MNEVYARRELKGAGILSYLLKGSIFLFSAGIIASLFVTLFNLLVPEVISFTIDCVIGNKPVPDVYARFVEALGGTEYLRQNTWALAVSLAVIALLCAVLNYLRQYLNIRANQTFMRRTRNKLFAHIQRLPLDWHNAHSTGDIIQRCTSDADTISNFISMQLVTLFRVIILIVCSLVFMFMKNVRLALIASAFIPLFLGYSLMFYAKARKSFKKCDEEEGVLSKIAQENFTGVRVVRAFGKERYEQKKKKKQNKYYTGLWTGIEKYLALFWASNDFLALVQGLLLIVIGTIFCVNGELSEGDLVAFISYNTMLMGPVRQLGRIISNMSKAGVSLARIGEILNAAPEEYGEEGGLSGDIEFRNVSFGYEEGKRVLENVSFTVPQGGILGIVGVTGSGKSTVTKLLGGLFHADGGEILIGGRNIKDISPATLRKNMGLMLQEGYIYSRTVGENIALAADGASSDGIVGAAQLACVDENIRGFANGYDTVVGERGVTLSGGQKQRIALARTLLRNTPYIVLDDCLSAVDAETDAEIRTNLKEKYGDATVIIISHRISTVMDADNIIVLEDGKVAESGTHAALMSADGLYAKIYGMQTALPDELTGEA